MTAIYNEVDSYACAWLRNLSSAGHILAGEVDGRSVVDVAPDDVCDAVQFHAFAGIGCWSHALRVAGWPDNAPVWTGSCPCQPFSAAGRRKGIEDARHLWPEWFRLIRECRPPVVFGEQVASPDGLVWLDAVSADMEGAGYAFAAADLCAAGVGAPHIRQRLYFVAYAKEIGRRPRRRGPRERCARQELGGWSFEPRGPRASGGVANTNATGLRLVGSHAPEDGDTQPRADADGRSSSVGVAHGDIAGSQRWLFSWDCADKCAPRPSGVAGRVGNARCDGDRQHAGELHRNEGEHDEWAANGDHSSFAASATRGFWGGADWIYCRDGKHRPVEPGSFPLAHGAPERVGRLRAYGNAIVPQVAATFIGSVMDVLGLHGDVKVAA